MQRFMHHLRSISEPLQKVRRALAAACVLPVLCAGAAVFALRLWLMDMPAARGADLPRALWCCQYVQMMNLFVDDKELFVEVSLAHTAEIMPLVYTPVVR